MVLTALQSYENMRYAKRQMMFSIAQFSTIENGLMKVNMRAFDSAVNDLADELDSEYTMPAPVLQPKIQSTYMPGPELQYQTRLRTMHEIQFGQP